MPCGGVDGTLRDLKSSKGSLLTKKLVGYYNCGHCGVYIVCIQLFACNQNFLHCEAQAKGQARIGG